MRGNLRGTPFIIAVASGCAACSSVGNQPQNSSLPLASSQTSSSDEFIEPEVTGMGIQLSRAGVRYIDVYRQAHTAENPAIVHFFHKPMFILMTNSNPRPGAPNIVWND